MAGALMLTTGRIESTVKLVEELPVLPARSVWVTVIVWLPWVSVPVVKPLVQETAVAPSTEQVELPGLASTTEKLTDGVAEVA